MTTKQFLEYAKEVEELFQISNIKMDDIIENTNQTTKEQSLTSITNTPNSNNQYTTISPSNKMEHVYSRYPNIMFLFFRKKENKRLTLFCQDVRVNISYQQL